MAEPHNKIAGADHHAGGSLTIDVVREAIDAFDLEAYSTTLEAAALLSIRLQSRKVPVNARRSGRTRLGGLPDLPRGTAWPMRGRRPLAFLAQIRLSGLAAYDVAGLLPRSGLLFFFYDAQQQPWGNEAGDRDGRQIIYWADESASLAPASPPPDLAITFSPRALRPMSEWTLPGWESPPIPDLGFSDTEHDDYVGLANSLYLAREPVHRIFGHADSIQGDMGYDVLPPSDNASAAYATEHRRWHLLLQVDTDDEAGMRWGDEGRLYFWIEEAALRARQFEHVQLVLQCY